MDALTIYSVIGGASVVLTIGVFIGSRKVVQRDLEAVDHKVRNIQHWRDGLPTHLDAVYVRQKELALELKPIHESLKGIEADIRAIRGGVGV